MTPRLAGDIKRQPALWLAMAAAFLLLLASPVRGAGDLVAHGQLVTNDGMPASFVSVLLEITDMRIRRQIGYARAESAADGTFTFDLDQYGEIPELGLQFNTLSPRYRDAIEIVRAGPDDFPVEVKLTLEPGSVAKGRVIDDTGAPVEGAEVSIPGSRMVTTTETGEFELFGLPATGRSTVTAMKQGYVEKSEAIESSQPTLIEGIELVLVPASSLTGKVIDPDGNPVSPARVQIRLEEQMLSRLTRPDGTFEFRAVPEHLEQLKVEVLTDSFLFEPRNFTPQESEAREATLIVHWPLRLAGVIRTPQGDPFSGGTMAVGTGRDDRPRTFPISMAGEWEALPFEPGSEILLTAMPPEPEQRFDMGELDFTMENNPGQWKAEVAPWPKGYNSAIEASVQGNTITMIRHDEGLGGLPGTVRYSGTLSADGKMMEGTVEIPALKAKGTWKARAYSPQGGIKGVWDLREKIEEGEYLSAPVQKKVKGAPLSGTQYVELVMSEPLELKGRVLRQDGTPAVEGLVYLQSWNGSRILSRTAPIGVGGTFSLRGLPDGVLEVVALDGSNQMIAPAALARGGLTDFVIGSSPEPDPMDPVVPTK